MNFQPFGYRHLGASSPRFYQLAPDGRIYIRGKHVASESGITQPGALCPLVQTVEPFSAKEASGLAGVWNDHGEAWELRTHGPPLTVRKIRVALAKEIEKVAIANAVDARLLIVQVACEAAYSSTDPSGKDPLSPRTEPGYPGRTGENDHGDPERDALDVAQSGGRHASYGLTQCLLSTARSVRPDLFAGKDPRTWRNILAVPENALACIAAVYNTLPIDVRADPLATRATFGAGRVIRDDSNGWGVRVYAVSVISRFVAFWNDLAADLEESGGIA